MRVSISQRNVVESCKRKAYTLDISLNHLLYKLVESDLALPSEDSFSLGRSTVKEINLGGTLNNREKSSLALFISFDCEKEKYLRTHEVPLIDSDQNFTSLRTFSNFVDSVPLTFPLNSDSNVTECLFDEFSYWVSFTSCENEIVGFVLLQHAPHSFNVVASVSPITFGVEVTEVLEKRERKKKSKRNERNQFPPILVFRESEIERETLTRHSC